jgi:predicted nucleic acid-binding protein
MSRPVLDSGAVSRLAEHSRVSRNHLRRLKQTALWPPLVPTVVLAEALRGDPRRDVLAERLLATCEIEPVDELTARRAAWLRGRARRGSAVDAVVVATAEAEGGGVLTQDLGDIAALSAHTERVVEVERV